MRTLLLFITIIFFAAPSNAQLCQGSLGDPIVLINFGAGPNPGPALNAAATGYGYTPSDCPNDGFYTVRSATTSCFGSTWHNVARDHTGNSQGYFMLVNASFQPSDFYVDTVRGLCANSSYEFAAWILNVIKGSSCNANPNQPNLSFQVETETGNILKAYNTGNIVHTTVPAWVQFGSYFTTPPGVTSIVLRIRNNAPGGCGNDLALDDISFRPCGPLLSNSINGQASSAAGHCEGIAANYQLQVNVSAGFSNPVYQWQQMMGNQWTDIPGATATNFVAAFPSTAATGSYTYRLAVAESGNLGIAQCRVASPVISINIFARPAITINNPGPACAGTPLKLTASGAETYTWTHPQGAVTTGRELNIQPLGLGDAGRYMVSGTSAQGCTAAATTDVAVFPSPDAALAFYDSSICAGQSIVLMANPSPGYLYNWFPSAGITQPNISSPTVAPGNDTRYGVEVTNSLGCKDTAYVNIQIRQLPVANAGQDKYALQGQPVQLIGSIQGAYSSFSWEPSAPLSNASSLTPALYPSADSKFYLYVNSACGMVVDSVEVKLYLGLYIPNSFTPNRDGLNDTWNVPALNAFPGFRLTIFNRYGQKVYQNRDNFIAWDGKRSGVDQSPGIYTYIVELRQPPFLLKGTILLFR